MAAPAKKKKSFGGTIFFVIILACIIVGIYMTLNRSKNDGKLEADVKASEASVLIGKNLDTGYPQTPREVLKLYCRIIKCLYNEELSDNETRNLMLQLRKLYAPELLANNDEETMLSFLKGEIDHYHSNEMTINSYTVDSAAKIKYVETTSGRNAIIDMFFTVKEGAKFNRAYEEFVLTDAEGDWKIVGWQGSDETNITSDD